MDGYHEPNFMVNTDALKFLIAILADHVATIGDVTLPEGCNPIELSRNILDLNLKLQNCKDSPYGLSLSTYRAIRPAFEKFAEITGFSNTTVVDRIVSAVDGIIAGLTRRGLSERRDYVIS
jgi:hypothetical protein